ncbi:hypothetical protein [Streptomyces sp. NBC_01176]|nr:hypothetical protein OG199_15405 [Streptomyces sp. NBC_01176]
MSVGYFNIPEGLDTFGGALINFISSLTVTGSSKQEESKFGDFNKRRL